MTAVELVAVPPGSVTLRDRRTQTAWTERAEPFLLGAVPVTQARYRDASGYS